MSKLLWISYNLQNGNSILITFNLKLFTGDATESLKLLNIPNNKAIQFTWRSDINAVNVILMLTTFQLTSKDILSWQIIALICYLDY